VVQPEQQGEVSALQLAVFKAGRLVTTAIAPQRSPFRIDRASRTSGISWSRCWMRPAGTWCIGTCSRR
jgi:hypothetical protein